MKKLIGLIIALVFVVISGGLLTYHTLRNEPIHPVEMLGFPVAIVIMAGIINLDFRKSKDVLPTDGETEKWFEENIGISNNCSASSAIYKFRLWLNDRKNQNG